MHIFQLLNIKLEVIQGAIFDFKQFTKFLVQSSRNIFSDYQAENRKHLLKMSLTSCKNLMKVLLICGVKIHKWFLAFFMRFILIRKQPTARYVTLYLTFPIFKTFFYYSTILLWFVVLCTFSYTSSPCSFRVNSYQKI